MKYSTRRISWAAALAIAACICTADSIADKGQGTCDQVHIVTASSDTDSGDNVDDEDEDK